MVCPTVAGSNGGGGGVLWCALQWLDLIEDEVEETKVC